MMTFLPSDHGVAVRQDTALPSYFGYGLQAAGLSWVMAGLSW